MSTNTATKRSPRVLGESRPSDVRRWVGLVIFGIVLATTFVLLGQWQLRRLEERREQNAAVIAAGVAPIADGASILARPLTESDQYRRIRLRGQYLPDQQWVVRNRSLNGDRGFEVVTAMRTNEGVLVLVDRGFVLLPQGSQQPTSAPPPPGGEVEIVAVIRDDERGGPGAEDPAQGTVRVINAPAIARATGQPFIPGHLRVLESTPDQGGGLVPASTPDLSEGPHFSYAMQWFLFTIVGVIGVVLFIRGEIRARRARANTKTAAALSQPGSSS